MSKIKKYEDFLYEKSLELGINEDFFDKAAKLLKGKSEKGKIFSELLKKNSIPEEGSAYMIHFLGGATPGKEEQSHPMDYLHYNPGIAKITKEGEMILTDEKAKKLKVPDTISFLAVMEAEDIKKNWTFGLKPGSSVKKMDYSFDLSGEKITATITPQETYSIPKQTWIKKEGEDEVIEIGEKMNDEDAISMKTPIKMITLQEWVDLLNKTGWVKKDTKYFTDTMEIESAD